MNRLAIAAVLLSALGGPAAAQQAATMSFFVTSESGPDGANFGGLSGADAFCQRLAAAAGAGAKTWRAYLSAQAAGGQPAVNARDRIGNGPWVNAKGETVARNLDDLHADPAINKQTALTEKGAMVNGRGDTPNQHDILTRSTPEGRAPAGEADMTCGNWTRGGEGAAIVGHHDRIGLRDDAPSKSWNSSHPSRGCSAPALAASGGAGRLYCFAAN
ncbi:MAG: hypothetical protein HXY30_13435 [Pseudorhodoplanes sp.]|nr:hypothetical protein [Pseudorhodoplanes sp.]